MEFSWKQFLLAAAEEMEKEVPGRQLLLPPLPR